MPDRFPDQIAETIGQFEVVPRPSPDGEAEHADAPRRTGVLRLNDNRVQLEVSPGFNPMVSWTQRGPGSWAGSPPEERITDDAVVLGAIARQPGEVSLWGVRSVDRQFLGFPTPRRDEQRSRELLAVDWCLVGALLPSEESEFTAVELDVAGLHAFAAMSSVRTEFSERGMVPMTFVYDPPKAATGTTSIPRPGEVRFEPLATLPTLGGPDISVTTDTRLKMAFEGAVQLPVVVTEIAIPIMSLLTILYGSKCRVRRLNVSTPTGKSADVYGHIVDLAASRDVAGSLLAALPRVGGADFIGRWLDLAKRTSPVPQILAAAYAGEFATVEAEALYMCTAAETLHRRLNPDERRWSAETVEEGLSGLAEATLPDEVQQALSQALRQYLFEPSFPMRIEALATRVGEVLPGCVGRVNRWKRAVTDQRNALAHGLPPGGSDIDLTKMHAISRSLRWVLTLYLLLEAGAPAEQLAKSTQANDRYERDWRNWRREWPKVFVDSA
jgi:hypothetical protein